MKKETHDHKPLIETIINTSAIASMTMGVAALNAHKWEGLALISFAVVLEFFKYWGRKNNYW